MRDYWASRFTFTVLQLTVVYIQAIEPETKILADADSQSNEGDDSEEESKLQNDLKEVRFLSVSLLCIGFVIFKFLHFIKR